MKKIFFAMVLMMAAVLTAHADSIVRVTCDDADVGAEIYINGKFVGECPGPVDATVKEGTANLRARKVDGDYERLFEKQLRVADGVAQRVEVVLSAPQLTAEGRAKKQAGELKELFRAAEGGDEVAMRKLADLYDAGSGVEKSPAKAKAWREKAKVVVAQSWIRAAEGGRIDAMDEAAKFYDTGYGVEKSPAKAAEWREKAKAARENKAAREKAAAKQAKIASVDFFEKTHEYLGSLRGSEKTTSILSIWVPLAFDLLSAPTKTTELISIKSEAALRPSKWGSPDSMIARASRRMETAGAENEHIRIMAIAR